MSSCLVEFSQPCDVSSCLVEFSQPCDVLCLAVWVSSVSPVMYSCRVFRAGGETPGGGGRKLCQTHIPLY